MLRSTILVSFLIAALSQRPPANRREIPASLSPAEILRQVMQLRLSRDHYPQPGERPDAVNRFVADTWKQLKLPDKWDGYCTCSSLLLYEQSRFVVLRMDTADWEHRFVVFLSPIDSKDSWRLAGFADTFAKYTDPTLRVETNSVGTFLAVSHDTGGTGAFEEGESWYELDADRSREVLSFPTKGHNDPFVFGRSAGKEYSLSRNWEARLMRRPGDQDATVRVELTVDYDLTVGADSTALFSKKRIGVFKWDAASRTYKFDEGVSGISREEFELTSTIDSMNRGDFIKYNVAALTTFAEQGTSAQKEWLRGFLTEAGADPLTADLLRRIR